MMPRAYVPQALARQPWQVIIPLTMLTVFGGAVLYSAAGGRFQPWAAMHVIRFFGFLVMAMLLARVPRDWFKRVALPGYVILCGLLVLVELIGRIGGGSQRWLNLGFMTLQPSELMKPGIVLVLAWFYAMLPLNEVRGWRAIVPPLVILAIPAGLVMLQPDLGTALAISFGDDVHRRFAAVAVYQRRHRRLDCRADHVLFRHARLSAQTRAGVP